MKLGLEFAIIFTAVSFFIVFAIVFLGQCKVKAKEMFLEKDLDVCKSIKLNKKMTIKLYDLKKFGESHEFDREDSTYFKISRILNKHIKFDFDEETMEFKVELDDFRDDELRVYFTEILELVTNFRLSQFRFKSEENQFKLLGSDNKVIEEMKSHTDDIISVVFEDMMEGMYKDKLQGILDGIME